MERLWYIKHCRLFEKLTPDQFARLERRARVRQFPKNSAVYLPSDAADGVLLLAEGRVKLSSMTADGKEAILAFIEAGEIFGELSLVGESVREEHAETVLASTIILLPGDELEGLMAESPQLTLGVTKLIGWRRKRIERRLKALLFRSNRERLIHLLLDLAEQYGQSTSEGVLLSIRLSHQDLASIIGATRETVTVLLGELQVEGLLKIARQKLAISDLSRLAGCVDSAPPKLRTSWPQHQRFPQSPNIHCGKSHRFGRKCNPLHGNNGVNGRKYVIRSPGASRHLGRPGFKNAYQDLTPVRNGLRISGLEFGSVRDSKNAYQDLILTRNGLRISGLEFSFDRDSKRQHQ